MIRAALARRAASMSSSSSIMFSAGRIGRLDDEDIPSPDILVDLDEELTVREPLDRDLAERLSQVCRNLLGRAAGWPNR